MQRTTISKKAISKDYKNVYICLYKFNEMLKLLEWTIDHCLPEVKTRWRWVSNNGNEEGWRWLKRARWGTFLSSVLCLTCIPVNTQFIERCCFETCCHWSWQGYRNIRFLCAFYSNCTWVHYCLLNLYPTMIILFGILLNLTELLTEVIVTVD